MTASELLKLFYQHPKPASAMPLSWTDIGGYCEAGISNSSGGARFTITYHATCNRRGPWRLLIEVSKSWGCFDEADEPQRYYHSLKRALGEAQDIADAIVPDCGVLQKCSPKVS